MLALAGEKTQIIMARAADLTELDIPDLRAAVGLVMAMNQRQRIAFQPIESNPNRITTPIRIRKVPRVTHLVEAWSRL